MTDTCKKGNFLTEVIFRCKRCKFCYYRIIQEILDKNLSSPLHDKAGSVFAQPVHLFINMRTFGSMSMCFEIYHFNMICVKFQNIALLPNCSVLFSDKMLPAQECFKYYIKYTLDLNLIHK